MEKHVTLVFSPIIGENEKRERERGNGNYYGNSDGQFNCPFPLDKLLLTFVMFEPHHK